MTDREKLIELLSADPCGGSDCCACERIVEVDCYRKQMADHLIANGVTFSTDTKVGDKWTPTDERLPEHGDVVLCHHKHFDCQVICQWDKRSDVWLDNAWTYGTGCITHWMPLPEPPKEEKHER